MVDVNDDKSVEEALVKLVTDTSLLESLRSQIKEKQFRKWDDYAQDLIRHLSAWNESRRKATEVFSSRLQAWLHDQTPGAHDRFKAGDTDVILLNLGLEDRAPLDPSASVDRRTTIKITRLIPGPTRPVPRDTLDILADSDLLLLPGQDMLDAVVLSANEFGLDIPLPRRILVGSEQHAKADSLARTIYAQKSTKMVAEDSEQLLSDAYATFKPKTPEKEHELAVVISTFNRADFVSMNAGWLLKQISRDDLPVVCVVEIGRAHV